MNIHGRTAPAQEPVLTVLTEQEVQDLLDQTRFARLGTVDPQGYVHITPVNIVADGGKIYFRTAAGSKLTQLLLEEKVTLQADRVEGGQAYSFNVFARARLLTDSQELEYVSSLPLDPWLGTEKLEWVELSPQKLEGRRFRLGS